MIHGVEIEPAHAPASSETFRKETAEPARGYTSGVFDVKRFIKWFCFTRASPSDAISISTFVRVINEISSGLVARGECSEERSGRTG